MRNFLPLLAFLFFIETATSQTPTALNGFYRSGQVFLTWQKIPNSEAYYKIYRSTSPISDSTKLPACEYLGWVNKTSAKDFNLSTHDGTDRYFHLDSAGAPLSADKGLFVATTLINGSYYYAVTSILNGVEKKKVTTGVNSLAVSISESVAKPVPVFQEQRTMSNQPYNIYATFFSSKLTTSPALINAVGFMAFDIAVYLNHAVSPKPLTIRLHPGGSDFTWTITTVSGDEINLNLEDESPGGDSFGQWGANENYDTYKLNEDNVPPVSGTNYNFIQLRLNNILDWAITHLPVDSNRISLYGDSNGAPGAYFYALTYPQRIAAVKLSVGVFNLAFTNDYNPECTLNTGKSNRKDANNRLGKISTNLMCNLGLHTYDALNGGWMIHNYNDRDYPVMYSINGKNDKSTGWTEKTIYYDSINANRLGGYFFWDSRDHGGANKTWTGDNFDLLRYRKNLSFPAFSHCSTNEDFGDGNGATGAAYGTINGPLDWKTEIMETAGSWQAKLFVRDLSIIDSGTVHYPDSIKVDVTPRRLQAFKPDPGVTVSWTVKHKNQVIQSGSFVYEGGWITIPQVKVFRDTSVLELTSSSLTTFYIDLDNDGYGSTSQSVMAVTPPPGYVSNHTDCNDANAAIHPGAVDVCNGVDDDCNGSTDEHAIVATISPSDTVTICKESSVTLSANSGTGLLYQWVKGTANISGATKKDYTTTVAGSYYVKESNSFNCSASSPKTKITTVAKPTAKITPQGSLDICLTGSVVLKTATGAGYKYQWKKNSSNIAGATTQSYTATTTGSYKVVVTNAGCSKTSPAVNVTSSCREDGALNDSPTVLSVYPNPTAGLVNFNLQLNNDVEEEAVITVTNILGQHVYSKTLQVTNGRLNWSFRFNENDSEGFYFLVLKVAGQSFTTKVLYRK
jgi:hypothetical protein